MTKTFLMILTLILTISAALVCITLVGGKTMPFEMISVRKCHTYVYTNDLEVFTVSVLISDPYSPQVFEEAISNVFIESATSMERIPIEVVDIVNEGRVRYDGRDWHLHVFVLRVAFYTEALTINMKEAFLVYDVLEKAPVQLDIGEFNYVFTEMENAPLMVHERYNLHTHIDGIPTSVGMVLTFTNRTADDIEILSVSLNASHVKANIGMMRLYEGETKPHLTLADALGEDYDIFTPAVEQREPIILGAFSEQRVILPFSYVDRSVLLHRYPLIVRVSIEGRLETIVIDDFTFIRTRLFEAVHPYAHVSHGH